MSLDSKVVWGEGMFLNPQHFQQQERYFERYIDGKCAAYGAYGWGVESFEVDQQLLKLGKISVVNAKGIFPDGTPFSFPDVDNSPKVLELPESTHNKVIYLAIPVRRAGAVDVLADEEAQGLARYYSAEQPVRDVTVEGSDSLKVNVGKLRIRLLTEDDDMSGYACVGLLRVAESSEDKNIKLDENFIPTCLNSKASTKLKNFLSELVGLLHHRAEAIAGRLADTRRGGTAEIADYMLLQLINRLEPLAHHLQSVESLHPIDLYREIVQMVGELSTFFAKNKRALSLPAYRHQNLQDTFTPVISGLRQCLSMVYEQTATALELVEKKYGIRVVQIPDRTMLNSGVFVLAARADLPDDSLRGHLPRHIKIASVERIRQLVNAALPGIAIKPLPVSPRQIPFRSGYNYFELEKNSDYWKELKNSGGIAIHIGGDFPGLELEFWAIRQ
ncbi:type VI secretion system baseplate subunit TssK [Aliikangiella sp. G2MR2-5]|uniref:type VI secretion system baseplate subunit TssK n=1 Tax=Aliikangiella sp. G2MR2-5 TaxID=2788943 RepID=UPI0018AB5241|nr:type VI secretion system baseplate subunit TssK [Aliikangiella sp. G2MR2-5]